MEHHKSAAHMDLGKRQEKIADVVIDLLYHLLDEDPDSNQHLQNTPERFAKWITGYLPDPRPFNEVVKVGFRTDFRELVAVTNIRFTSLCAHHLLPFRGKASVGYIPGGEDEQGRSRIIGISKLARAVIYFAKRITIQEDITHKVAAALEEALQPKGVMVVIEAEHMCMSIRGVEQSGSTTITSAARGCFLTNELNSKDEFLHLVKLNGVNS